MTEPHRPRVSRILRRLSASLLLVFGVTLAPIAPVGTAPVGQAAGLAPGGDALLAPMSALGPATVQAAGTCTGWTSDTTPPPTIRVLRTTGPADGTVQVVPFQDYVNVVMAAEWGASDPVEALKAGAVAVKEYAWYWAIIWRGGTAADGSCYDVVDSTVDQLYSPETRTPAPVEIDAVTATWGVTMIKSDALFPAHYDGGTNVPCGSDANGWQLRQRSAMNCATNGMLFDAILTTYYANMQIVGSAATPGPAGSVALAFQAAPSAATSGVVFAVQPAVAVVDGTGQPVSSGAGSDAVVTLALAPPVPGASFTCTGGLSRAAISGVATFDGCMVVGAATAIALTATAPNLAPATTPPFAIALAPPTVTVAATPQVVTWGEAVSLPVTLAPPGAEPPLGRTVQIQRSTDGITWTSVADAVTDASGAVTSSDRPAANSYYRAVFAGAPDLSAANSNVTRVVVRQIALLRPLVSGVKTIARGSKVTFTTTVRPARPELPKAKVTFTFVLKRGSTVVYSGKRDVYINAAGQASWTWPFSSPGEWYVRAIADPTTANANSLWSPLQHYHVG